MWQGQRVAVVIPAYNEERLIQRTLAGIPPFVDRIIVVDDASSDRCWSALSALRDPRLVRLRHAENRGVGRAIVSGYYRALREGAELMVVMAGDNQMLPSDMPSLLDAAVSGADYVKGNRLEHPSAARMPRMRRWGSRALSALTRLTTGLDVGDCQCGYTVLRAETAASLPLDELWPRYGYPNDLLALLARAGASVRDVPVSAVYADEKSGLHAGHMLSIALRILQRWREARGQPRPKRTIVPSSAAAETWNPVAPNQSTHPALQSTDLR